MLFCTPMTNLLTFFICLFTLPALLPFQANARQMPLPYSPVTDERMTTDWLITPVKQKAAIYYSADKKNIILYNGLVRRVFSLMPGLACVDYKNISNGQQLLRAIQPEAKIEINKVEYKVGGLYGQQQNAYLLPQWTNELSAAKSDFDYTTFSINEIPAHIKWKSNTWASNKNRPGGKMISFHFRATNNAIKGIDVSVNYELYDGLPLIVKWISVNNKGAQAIQVGRMVNEVLAIVEEESAVSGSPAEMKKQHGIYVETNYAFNGSMRYDQSDQVTHWKTDSAYTSQVNYYYQTPCLLEIYPEQVSGNGLQPGETIQSLRTYELLIDTYDRERRGLMIRKMYRTVAPWTTQNPIFMHLVSKNNEEVFNAIDQCAATGYEALILSFGSHCNMEDTSAQNIAQWKKIAGYAHGKNIQIGSYSLFSSRKISEEDDVINPSTGSRGGTIFGNAPCFGSQWGIAYSYKIKYFIAQTGFNIWENDGPYPGDVCASTMHPGHKGKEDSQWRQAEMQKELYRHLNENGVYINAPDWYFLDGTHKTGLGYREVNFSLPREQQMILNRQNIFDGTWEKTPSMGWGFVPLTRYQGGGPEAVLEPLSEHLKDYEQLMMQYYGAGVQACYRGPRLYDTETTRKTVSKVISWYKKYRDILNSDIIHLRRADGRDWDGWLHVNPLLKQKGLMMIFNPTKEIMTRTLHVPLYYTGLATSASVSIMGAPPVQYPLRRDHQIQMKVNLEPESFQWILIE